MLVTRRLGARRRRPTARHLPAVTIGAVRRTTIARSASIPRDVIDFILATQPKEWEKLKQHHGADVEARFLNRLASEIERRGALDVLRSGIKDSGCGFLGLLPAVERAQRGNSTPARG